MRGRFTLMVVLVLAGACTRTFKGETTQPNPLVHPTETLRQSERITIVRGDMELTKPPTFDDQDATTTMLGAESQRAKVARHNKYPLLNQASFTIVSRDRLRFHVQVDHKWQDWADLSTWDVELIDDKGRHWKPEAIEHPRVKIMTTMWDREQRTAVCSSAGRDATGNCFNTVGYQDDGWRRRQTLGSLSVYRGRADFVFYQRDLFNANVRMFKLKVSRPGEAFHFTWNFQDPSTSE